MHEITVRQLFNVMRKVDEQYIFEGGTKNENTVWDLVTFKK
jgi:hypothetical protein